jgi:pseudaminic acid biosynthesis-associated methylase
MIHVTEQMEKWAGVFGREYTDRNDWSIEDVDAFYLKSYGITRTMMNRQFLMGMPSSMRILEVGCNVGNQLLLLKRMGFTNLYGIELQDYAVEKAKSRTPAHIHIIKGAACDIPFRDGYFDMVFTSGLLIHINPADLHMVLEEIYRCTREYIWGFEYYADLCTEINYRGNKNVLWKNDFAKLYLDSFDDLELIKDDRYKYIDNDNFDAMFLLRKTQEGMKRSTSLSSGTKPYV